MFQNEPLRLSDTIRLGVEHQVETARKEVDKLAGLSDPFEVAQSRTVFVMLGQEGQATGGQKECSNFSN